MKIVRLEMQNIRCFVDESIELAPGINVVVGPNNNGKTSLLNCLSLLQEPRMVGDNYRRINTDVGAIRIWVDKTEFSGIDGRITNYRTLTSLGHLEALVGDQHVSNFGGAPNQEPNNFIIPYQSKRKVGGYSEGITSGELNQVTGTLYNLYAKIDRISNPEFQPAYQAYTEACDHIIGFRVSTSNSGNGKKAAYVIRNEQHIPIDMMGEGISNLLGLIVDLCRVETNYSSSKSQKMTFIQRH